MGSWSRFRRDELQPYLRSWGNSCDDDLLVLDATHFETTSGCANAPYVDVPVLIF